MEFLDTRNASEDEKREIEKILSNRSSSIEFPFEINHSSKSLNCNGEKEVKFEENYEILQNDKNEIDCNQMCSIPSITHFSDHFIPNHLASNVSSYPANFYGHKTGPTLPNESELYYFGSSYGPVANSSKVDSRLSIGEDNSVKVPLIPISAHYAPVNLSSISQVGLTNPDISNRGPLSTLSCSSDPNLCTGIEDSAGCRASTTPFGLTFNPHPNTAYLSSTAFIPTPGANFPTPPHVYPYMFQMPFPPFYSVTTHLPSNLSLASSVQRDHNCSYNNINSSNNMPQIKSYDKKQIIKSNSENNQNDNLTSLEREKQASKGKERKKEREKEKAEKEDKKEKEKEKKKIKEEEEKEKEKKEENKKKEKEEKKEKKEKEKEEEEEKEREKEKQPQEDEKKKEETKEKCNDIKFDSIKSDFFVIDDKIHNDGEPEKYVNSLSLKVNQIENKKNKLQIKLANNSNKVFLNKSNQSCLEVEKEDNKKKDELENLNFNNNTNNLNQMIGANNSSSLRSWADLFKEATSNLCPFNSNNSVSSSSSANPFLSSRLYSNDSKSDDDNEVTVKCGGILPTSLLLQEDIFAIKIGKRLKEIHLKHSLPYLLPRGFVNKGNWCYINATLQALLYCPPFYNLMREVGEVSGIFREKSSTPIIDSFAKFFSNFLPCEPMMKKSKHSNSNFSEGLSDIPKGEPFEPKCIYEVLCYIKSECLKGKQEDAEEFLSSVLNGLHDEIIFIFKFLEKQNHESDSNIDTNGHLNFDETNEHKTNGDDNDSSLWNVVGPRHKTLPTRSTKVKESPIVDIFGGSIISVRTAGTDKCGNKQPFFTLQLDIQSEKIKSIEDALRSLTSRELIQGYTCPKTKQMMDASYQTFLEQLPPILILHLKLFVYDKDGGSKKLMKKIDYPIDLDLPRDCLHIDRNDKNKYSKSYKLLSVVYHDGNESVKGHYLTDIFHIGSSNWLRCDDTNIKTINTQQLLNPQAPRVPYLLFYRRCDTLRGSNSNQPQRGFNNSQY